MNEQKDRARFHRAIDRTLSGLPEDPFLVSRIAARTAARGKGENMKNRKLILMMVTLTVLCLGTVAVAGGVFGGTVDWNGNLAPDLVLPTSAPTMVPETMIPQVERETLMATFNDACPPADGQLAVYYDLLQRDTPIGWMKLSRSIEDMQQFETMMAAAQGFVLPVNIPEGYAFYRGRVYYGCKAESEFQLVKTVNSEDGFRTEFYELDEKDQVITGYELDFRREGHADPLTAPYVAVYARIRNTVHDDAAMYLLDVVASRAATVPGMEKAVAVQGTEHSYVSMYGTMQEGITFRPSVMEDAITCHTVDIAVSGNPAMEELLSMFGGK